ncbi:hypothetical protein [Novacetimonas sp. GS1]|uniref:hypothetical protein n=1 Tax=Novacetimonas sp. GS1 TaxID=3119990 RepID=UPI002FCCF3AF
MSVHAQAIVRPHFNIRRIAPSSRPRAAECPRRNHLADIPLCYRIFYPDLP